MKIEDTSGQDIVIERGTMPVKRKILYGAGAALLLALLVSSLPALMRWSRAEISVSAERLRTAVVSRGDFVRDISVQGRIVAAVSPTLYAVADGIVTYSVDAGDEVKAGAALARIDSPELSNRLKQEEASLQSLQVDYQRSGIQSRKQQLENQKVVDMAMVALNAAKREKARADNAYGKNAISEFDYQKAQDELQNAKLAHEHAVKDAALNRESLEFELQTASLQINRQQLLVDELKRQVDDLIIRSPVGGIVGNLLFGQKSSVSKNAAVLSVVDLSAFEVEVKIPESYADSLALGMAAELSLNNQQMLGSLVSISPEINNNEVIGRIRFDDESPQGLRQNQRLSARILLDQRADVLTVARGQFLESGSGRVAYRVANSVAHRVAIETGARSLAAVEILAGLSEGDTIIISSTEGFDGAENILITH